MRILLINGNTTQAVTDGCADAAREVAAPGTEIVALTAREGPRFVQNRTDNVLAGREMLELAAQHAGHCDAVVIAVSYDTALGAMRELMPVPVVGMTEAAAHCACLLGGRIGLVTFGKRSAPIYRELLDGYGLASRCAGVEAIELGPAQAAADPQGACRAIAELCNDMVERRGAETLVLAGAVAAAWQKPVQAMVPVPVLEGVRCAVLLAESLVRLAPIKPTAGSYQPPGQRTDPTGWPPALTAYLAMPSKR
jgi:allantoin racemase